MKNIKNDLQKIINITYEKYSNLPEELTSIKLSDEKWSLKEIIGHLIDSASNNHQRFIRLQIDKNLNFPIYHYSWIEIEKFNSMIFKDLLLLWKQYNLLIIHIIDIVDKNALNNIWNIDNKTQITLKDLIIDYLRHLKEHIEQFKVRYNEIKNNNI